MKKSGMHKMPSGKMMKDADMKSYDAAKKRTAKMMMGGMAKKDMMGGRAKMAMGGGVKAKMAMGGGVKAKMGTVKGKAKGRLV